VHALRLSLALALATALLAGCSGKGGAGAEADPTADLGLEATKTTGVIRGVVVDQAIAPVAGVLVSLSGGGNATTNADGAFGFEGLEPGTYFLTAHKPGFADVQQSADVAAGVAEPPVVKVQMAADVSTLPTFDVFSFHGYLECSFVIPGFFVPCEGVGNDHNAATFAINGEATFIHVSLVWEPTQAFGRNLYFNVLDNYDDYNVPTWNGGPSPLFGDANATAIGDSRINEQQGFTFEVSSDGEGVPGVAPGLVGASLQQAFDAYVVVFHGFAPPEGYNYVEDGEPQPPTA
jgi:hypothetical protein